MPIDKEILDEIALTQGEYDLIVERLGREPNALELGMFGALWSEHCGYKHSKPLLRQHLVCVLISVKRSIHRTRGFSFLNV